LIRGKSQASIYAMKSLFCLLAMVSACHAISNFDTLTTKSGRTYETVRVTKQDPDGIRITHSEGAAKIFFTDLPNDILALYDYNPDAAKAHQQKILETRLAAENEKKAQALLDERGIEIEGKVFQVQENGVLVIEAVTAMLSFPDGTERPASPASLKAASKLTKAPPMREVNVSPSDLSSIFIEGSQTGLVDNQRFTALVWPIGTHRYLNTQGIARTIPKYTATAAVALAAYTQ
jgi:hypothetical protein